MNIQTAVKITTSCLKILAKAPNQCVSVEDLSKRCRIPVDKCMLVMQQLARAGFVSVAAGNVVRLLRDAADLSAFKILSALLTIEKQEIHPALWSNIERLLAQSQQAGNPGSN